MKNWKSKVAAGMCLGLVLTALPAAGGAFASVKAEEKENLLVNGAFEEAGSGPTGEEVWALNGLARTEYEKEDSAVGKWGLKMTGTENASAVQKLGQALAAGTYKGQVQVNAAGCEGEVVLEVAGETVSYSIAANSEGKWNTYSIDVELDEQVSDAEFAVSLKNVKEVENGDVSGGDVSAGDVSDGDVSGGDAGSTAVIFLDNFRLELVSEKPSEPVDPEKPVDPVIPGGSGGSAPAPAPEPISWDTVSAQVTEQLNKLKANPQAEAVNVNFVSTEETVVPLNILQVLQGQNVTAAFHNGKGVAMSITGTALNSKNMKGVENLNLTVTCDEKNIPENLMQEKTAGTHQYRTLSLKNAGVFSVPVNMHIAVKKEYAGKYANLYQYNKEKNRFDYDGSFQITENGQCMFGVRQGGEYLLTVTDTKAK